MKAIIILLTFSALQAQSWVRATSEPIVIQNITPEQAFYRAKQNARKEAIRKVLGTHIQQSAIVQNATFAGEFIHAFSYGHILNEKVENVDIKILQPSSNLMPILTCQVTMKCEVVEEKGKPDVSFKVKAELNSLSFTDGDEMIIRVKSTKECFITVLNITATDDIYVLFPNQYRKKNKIFPDETIEIPSAEDRQNGLHFRVNSLPGHKEDTEYIKVLATRQPIGFLEDIDEESGFKKFKNNKYALTELAQWLTMVPANERAEDFISYIVVSGE